MDRAICPLSMVPVRKGPGDREEMTTQWLFGETADVLERTEKWTLLRFDHDHYEGWVDNKQIQPTRTRVLHGRTRAADVVVRVRTQHTSLVLPMGAVLPTDDESAPIPITGKIHIEGQRSDELEGSVVDRVLKLAPLWLGAPYLWGGRTPWGVDCSGFTQMLFLLCGVELPRDAWQQAGSGKPVDALDLSRTGDLAFFQNEHGRVVHVGLILDAENGTKRILHASGRVRIDTLDAEGIFHAEEKRHTHKLHSLKRVL